MNQNTKKKDIRDAVAADYARAITSKNQSCCGSKIEPKDAVAKLAKYSDADFADLPADVIINSFGCGNPLAFSEVKSGQTVLDLGSGAGMDLLIAARRVGPQGKVIGIDMTDEMIAKARENIARSSLKNIEVRKGYIEELPVETESVDWVISNCVINLSPDKDKVFKEITRVLRPGGKISISDVVAESLPEEALASRTLYSACIAGAIDEATYVQKLTQAGLTDVKVTDRLVYDVAELQSFISSEAQSNSSGCGCGCSGKMEADPARSLAQQLHGKVWSVKVTGTKPGSKTDL